MEDAADNICLSLDAYTGIARTSQDAVYLKNRGFEPRWMTWQAIMFINRPYVSDGQLQCQTVKGPVPNLTQYFADADDDVTHEVEAGAYTRPLLSSTRAVSDTQTHPTHPKHPLTPP